MMQYAVLVSLNSIMCVGLYKAMYFEIDQNGKPDNDTKNILWFWKYYFVDKLPVRLGKPFGGCLTCMASVFSFVPYWWFNCWNFSTFECWIFYPFYIFTLAGANTIFDKIVNE